MSNKHNNRMLQWLLILNLIALVCLGARQFYFAQKAKHERQKRAENAAAGIVRTGTMNSADATRLFEISDGVEHGEKISDSDLQWCLEGLQRTEGAFDVAAGRRNCISMILRYAIHCNVLSQYQRELVTQAELRRIALDDPRNEAGTDVTDVALAMSELNDRRALSLLRSYIHDRRPIVRHTVGIAVNRLDGGTPK